MVTDVIEHSPEKMDYLEEGPIPDYSERNHIIDSEERNKSPSCERVDTAEFPEQNSSQPMTFAGSKVVSPSNFVPSTQK